MYSLSISRSECSPYQTARFVVNPMIRKDLRVAEDQK